MGHALPGQNAAKSVISRCLGQQGLSIRRKLLSPNNRTWDGLVC
jgi:hypothetical protein